MRKLNYELRAVQIKSCQTGRMQFNRKHETKGMSHYNNDRDAWVLWRMSNASHFVIISLLKNIFSQDCEFMTRNFVFMLRESQFCVVTNELFLFLAAPAQDQHEC
jgi:hypothetical protein